ncbi:glycosyltransferase family 4 protein [Janibacter sp. G56]|uniref:glycosyltransferase family 4 protein n=1 Tax=Janibacter sp. G56 TaxID=3418717 RepID=UPI003D054744
MEEHVRHVARELVAQGADVQVWTVDRGEHLGSRVVDGVPVRYLPTPLPARDVRSLASFGFRAPAAWSRWWRAFRAFRPEVLHVQCFGPNGLYALALHRATGTPLIVSAHGETLADDHGAFEESALLRAGLREAITRAAVVTGCSEFALRDLRERFGLTGGVVVPNGVDLDEPVGPPPVLTDGAPVVFAVGRVERMKGFDLLLDAVARFDDVRVVIGGDGAALADLREQASALGLGERATFLGRLSRPEVGAWMGRADVVAVPSRREAFGIVVLEAWRAGTPVVVTNRGGTGEFVMDGQDGLLVDPTDIDALAAALRRVLADPRLADEFASAGRQRVESYTWAMVAERYRSIQAEAEAEAEARDEA